MTPGHPETSKAHAEAIADDERELLLRHRAGDPRAFGGLVTAYRRPVYSYLIRCGVAECDRDDLFQEIFVKIHAAAAQYEEDCALHPWLFTIVANTVRTYHRKSKVRALVFGGRTSCEPQTRAADGERNAMAKQIAYWLEQAIPNLPIAQQEVLVLTCIEELPQKEVARILDLPINTVKTLLRRARLSLVRSLAQHNRIRRGEVPS
jgi:RNA polymerase sigma-70 factor (ECF subfamily)